MAIRISIDGQIVDAQRPRLEGAGASHLSKEKLYGAKRDRVLLDKMLSTLNVSDVVIVTRLERLARSAHDPLNILAIVADKGASFGSLRNGWADTTTARGWLASSSRNPALYQEAVAMIRRASPVPAPPSGQGSETIALAVPVRFSR